MVHVVDTNTASSYSINIPSTITWIDYQSSGFLSGADVSTGIPALLRIDISDGSIQVKGPINIWNGTVVNFNFDSLQILSSEGVLHSVNSSNGAGQSINIDEGISWIDYSELQNILVGAVYR